MDVAVGRLRSDSEDIQRRFRDSPHVIIKKATGDPPDRYEIEYRIRSLAPRDDGRVVESRTHVVEISLSDAYPRRAPKCRMLTAIFHPEISGEGVRVGAFWGPSRSLSDLIVHIGEIIAYQRCNTANPVNALAARWAEKNKHVLPLDSADLTAGGPEGGASGSRSSEAVATDRCQNCETPASKAELVRCVSGHVVCPACTSECENCAANTCVLCWVEMGGTVVAKGCPQCVKVCPSCDRPVYIKDMVECRSCGESVCGPCILKCSGCGQEGCRKDISPCGVCGRKLCGTCATRCTLCPETAFYHKHELTPCEECKTPVCPSHQFVSTVSTVTVCETCALCCGVCLESLTSDEALSCAVCEDSVCERCVATCTLCDHLVCPTHLVPCETCGKAVCDHCRMECPTCGKRVCRSDTDQCSVCSATLCRKCLETCPDCKKFVCAEHVFHCDACESDVCRTCTGPCASCEKVHHKQHLEKCQVCRTETCPECLLPCSRCDAKVCPTHSVKFSEHYHLCPPCFKRREKMVAIMIGSGVGVGIILLVLILLIVF